MGCSYPSSRTPLRRGHAFSMGLDAFPSEQATPVAIEQGCKQGWCSEGKKEKKVFLCYFSASGLFFIHRNR